VIIDDVSVKFPESVSDFLVSGYRSFGRAPVRVLRNNPPLHTSLTAPQDCTLRVLHGWYRVTADTVYN
jgi:hypothetical protein